MLSRSERIAQVKKASEFTLPNQFENVRCPVSDDNPSGVMSLKKFRIKTEFLVYNLGNGRTASIRDEKMSSLHYDATKRDLLANNENQESQDFQHECLKDCISHGEDKLLKQMLEKEGQKTAIWIKSDGTIVNGNRRVCALNEMDEEYIYAVLLPDNLDEKTIALIETIEQYGKDGKTGYVWHSQAKQFDHWIETGFMTVAEIAKNTYKKEQEILELVGMYKLGIEHLESIKKPNQWSLLNDSSEVLKIFHQSLSQVSRADSHTHKDIIKAKQIAFAIIENPKNAATSKSEKNQAANVVKNFFNEFRKDGKFVEEVTKEALELADKSGKTFVERKDISKGVKIAIDKVKDVENSDKLISGLKDQLEVASKSVDKAISIFDAEPDAVNVTGCNARIDLLINKLTKLRIKIESVSLIQA